ncbi:MAG: hypothetical protein CMH52_07920 [Myxococcales bacterium]|mgnify:CR=1 FL=1|nr:hypothetical protein [Myxococcales bacterium]
MMHNTNRFVDLVPHALRSVAYIHQSHVFKAYCALENLFFNRPERPDPVWGYCCSLIRDDEPKVVGVIAPNLL